MSERMDIGRDELLAILTAQRAHDARRGEAIANRMAEATGQARKATGTVEAAFMRQLEERVIVVMADRLIADDRSVPLVMTSDFRDITATFTDAVVAGAGIPATSEERAALHRLMQMACDAAMEQVMTMLPPAADPYQRTWDAVRATRDFCIETGLSPAETYGDPEMCDRLTRRRCDAATYRKEMAFIIERTVSLMTDTERLAKMIIDPLLAAVPFDDAEEAAAARTEYVAELERDAMPALRATAASAAAALTAYAESEIARIWPRA